MRHGISFSALLLVACGATATPMRLGRVVLYQNGVGYFERSGHADAEGVHLRLGAHEVDDVLTTLTVLDEGRTEADAAPSAVIPREALEEGESLGITVGLGGRPRDVTLTYSAPTSAWRASYRLVLPDERGDDDAWLQAWAVVDNTTAEDWDDVELTLATDAPLSFAVDLRTPRIVDRPNVTGHRVPGLAFGPVRSEASTRGDRDGDGIPDTVDQCSDDPEDRDDFQDDDGCPEPDNDHDAILDVDDQCPDDPETYNGIDDEEGCPDRGMVVISDARLQILEHVQFAPDSSTLAASSAPVLDAVAAALAGNPQIASVEVEGHADTDEESAWRVSAERAAVVRAELVARGVADARLVTRAYGSTRPIAAPPNARNRRVSFHLEAQTPTAPGAPPAGVRRESLSRSAATTPLPRTGSGGTRFPVARGVSVPAGASAMVTILHRPVAGEDVLLYRVDANVPSSAAHPFRAARLENRSGVDLIAGPISLFAGGELVGEGLLGDLRAGENAFVPYAVDDSTHIGSDRSQTEEPARLIGLADGRLTVERTATLRTTYRVEAGRRVAGRLFIRHDRAGGYEPVGLPPHTEARPEALLVPIPLAPGGDSTLVIEERRPVRAFVDLVRDLSVDLDPYLAGSELGPGVEARVRELVAAREALVRVREEASLLDRQLAEAARRTAELRQSVASLDERAGRTISPVRRRLGDRLEAAVTDSERVAERLVAIRADEVEALARLREAAQGAGF
ncbi:MAG: OmpA family protein [Sandaracinaceae bacterium]|nr:OmpA family protein [Sandaracinaceae bacterium]